MKLKKMWALLLAASMLFCTACSETAPIETESAPDWAAQPTPAPGSDQAIKLGETFRTNGAAYAKGWDENGPPEHDLLEVTVHGYTVYDHYSESGIPKEEFIGGSVYDIPQTPLVLVDLTIKKISGVEEDTGMEKWESITLFSLYGKKQLQWCEENNMEAVMNEPAYFSGHAPQNEDMKDYTYYWLDVGEEKDYQVGYFLTDPNSGGELCFLTTTEGGLLLRINDQYVDLDDQEVA